MSAAPAEDCAPAPAPTTKLLAPGDMVDGRYRIECYLGGGGMASVYRATHVVLEQAVAIKVVSPQIRELPGMAQRFLREARAATQLKSEHVARVSDVGTMADGAPYMVMEYLDGRDLDAMVETGEEVSVEDAVDYVLQACEALAEVHGLGIVHRDLKPANLFLTKGADGMPCVKLIDFGISRTDSPLASKDVAKLTQPDTVMGSPRYMSPEQMESAGKADSRSDIYGIGAVLYELLTHKCPHEGETFLDIYAAATLGPPEPPSSLRADVPHELDAVILRCLRIDPDERFNDTAELALALAPFGPEGSTGRADAIARILEAARSRTHNSASNEAVTSKDEGSFVRKRASSAHAVRRRRIRNFAMVAAVIAFAVLAAGGRVLYTQGQANGVATANAAPTLVVPPPPLGALPQLAAAPTAAAANTAEQIDIAAKVDAEDKAAAARAGAARTSAASTTTTAAAVAPKPAPVPAPVPVPVPAAPSPPRTSSWTAPAPSNAEQKLFEDRK
ncbi:MAG: serine/threonine protein kinase [Myxococcaceae bacterium]|jgi:serine/threonine-protein kinase|nr:serine/threonine protein kinase [Myxococcaceae bacterium]MEA2751496.1 eukaryotic-like serine/threonine-protein kinase [Myxococcales bacterium]